MREAIAKIVPGMEELASIDVATGLDGSMVFAWIEPSNSSVDWPAFARRVSPNALDLDRLFGTAEPADESLPPGELEPLDPSPATTFRWTPEAASSTSDTPAADESALPFDDGPIVPPPAARPPLSVRRSTPELPRNRPRTTRPVRSEPLQLEAEPHGREPAVDIMASLMETPALSARVGAGLVDTALLLAIDLTVLFLTLRITGLQNTLNDVRVLPPIPFIGFLALLAFTYVAAFTVGGGQTVGKMIMNLRVVGDGDALSLGGVTLVAHMTPGHTAGCTSWSMAVAGADGARHAAFFHCSSTVAGQSLAPEAYPGMVAAYRNTFARVRGFEADVFLANHGNFFDLEGKRARQIAGDVNAFVDPGALLRFNGEMEQAFEAELARQRGGRE